jgi:threonine/homoserine/homoserine lactone efflux protein
MITTLLIAFIFSFLGSIPPGSINLSVLQLALENKIGAALRFALAAAIVEFPYVIIALQFEDWLSSSAMIINNIKLITAIVMIALGAINTIAYFRTSPTRILSKLSASGFRKGLIISILNPMAIPFWVGLIAYLHHQKWIVSNNWTAKIVFALGVAAGTFSLLAALIYLSKKVNITFQKKGALQLVPASIFFILGFYALVQLVFSL